jgi:hypothetical protein
MTDDVVIPLHRRARDGRRILPDGRALDLAPYARQPTRRMVQLVLPISMVEQIDKLAKRDLLPRAAWLRSRLARAVESERAAS